MAIGAYCSCDRPLPCPQAASLAARRSTYEDALGSLVGPTVLVPVVKPLPTHAVVPDRWRWLRRRPVAGEVKPDGLHDR